jgi:hypothetical protein
VAARHRLDRDLAAGRQLRGALHRLRDRAAALADWPVPRVGTLNYAYKMCAAVALIPLLYLARGLIHGYLGHEQAQRMTEAPRAA